VIVKTVFQLILIICGSKENIDIRNITHMMILIEAFFYHKQEEKKHTVFKEFDKSLQKNVKTRKDRYIDRCHVMICSRFYDANS